MSSGNDHCFCRYVGLNLLCCKCSQVIWVNGKNWLGNMRETQFFVCENKLKTLKPCATPEDITMNKALGLLNHGPESCSLTTYKVINKSDYNSRYSLRFLIVSRAESVPHPVCVHENGEHIGFCSEGVLD